MGLPSFASGSRSFQWAGAQVDQYQAHAYRLDLWCTQEDRLSCRRQWQELVRDLPLLGVRAHIEHVARCAWCC